VPEGKLESDSDKGEGGDALPPQATSNPVTASNSTSNVKADREGAGRELTRRIKILEGSRNPLSHKAAVRPCGQELLVKHAIDHKKVTTNEEQTFP
jgi:hypothetical protein